MLAEAQITAVFEMTLTIFYPEHLDYDQSCPNANEEQEGGDDEADGKDGHNKSILIGRIDEIRFDTLGGLKSGLSTQIHIAHYVHYQCHARLTR